LRLVDVTDFEVLLVEKSMDRKLVVGNESYLHRSMPNQLVTWYATSLEDGSPIHLVEQSFFASSNHGKKLDRICDNDVLEYEL
jgi:hypothetical protein